MVCAVSGIVDVTTCNLTLVLADLEGEHGVQDFAAEISFLTPTPMQYRPGVCAVLSEVLILYDLICSRKRGVRPPPPYPRLTDAFGDILFPIISYARHGH